MATSAELRDQLAEADAVVSSAMATWIEDQAVSIAAFLDDEARLTVINQAAHTEEIAQEIPALRERLAVARDRAVARFREWARVHASEFDDIAQSFRLESVSFAREWIDAMLQAGYLSGTPRQYGSQARASWGFYYPATGTVRTSFVPSADSLRQLVQCIDRRKSVAFDLKRAAESEQRSRAADLWGN